MQLATAGATLGLTAALTLVGTGLSGDDDDGSPFEDVSDRPTLPLGSPIPGYAGAEDTAIELATELGSVEKAPGEPCPEEDLAVSWDDPQGFENGSHYEPVGPRPRGNDSANGVLFCEGFDFDYSGFSVDWSGTNWTADLAPDLGADLEGDAAGGGSGGSGEDPRDDDDGAAGGDDDQDPDDRLDDGPFDPLYDTIREVRELVGLVDLLDVFAVHR